MPVNRKRSTSWGNQCRWRASVLLFAHCLVGRCGVEVQVLESGSIPSPASSRLCGLDSQLSEPQCPHPLNRVTLSPAMV